MKKLILTLFVSLFFIGCKKEYTCTCTSQGQVVSKGVSKTTKKKAQENCELQQSQYLSNGYGDACKLQ